MGYSPYMSDETISELTIVENKVDTNPYLKIDFTQNVDPASMVDLLYFNVSDANGGRTVLKPADPVEVTFHHALSLVSFTHHWQHWILINDDPDKAEVILDMPYNYILEMICDWWSFSWKTGKLEEIFTWYDAHKAYMKLSDKTRETVEDILDKIKAKLEEED